MKTNRRGLFKALGAAVLGGTLASRLKGNFTKSTDPMLELLRKKQAQYYQRSVLIQLQKKFQFRDYLDSPLPAQQGRTIQFFREARQRPPLDKIPA